MEFLKKYWWLILILLIIIIGVGYYLISPLFIVVEINTLPGSISFYLWEKSNLKFKELITRLIELALDRFQNNKNTIASFSSNILENFGSGTKESKSN